MIRIFQPSAVLGSLVAAILLVAPSPSVAQVINLNNQPEATNNEAVEPPDPRNLQSDWWQYVDQSGTDLDRRIDRLNQSIDRAVLSLSLEDVGDMVELADLAKRNLNAYAEEVARAPVPFEATVRTSGLFTWDQLFEIPSKLRKANLEIDELRVRVNSAGHLSRRERQQLDEHMRAYRAGELDDVGRLRAGIQIVLGRATLSLEDLRAARNQARLSKLGEYVEQLQAQLAFAKENMDPSTWALDEAQARSMELNQQAVETRTRLGVRRRAILDIDESTMSGTIHANLARQELFAELLEEARLELVENRSRAEFLWHQSRKGGEAPLAEMEELIAELGGIQDQTDSAFEGWRNVTQSLLLEPPSNALSARDRELRIIESRGRELAVINLRRLRDLSTGIDQQRLARELLNAELATRQQGFLGVMRRLRLGLGTAWEGVGQWTGKTLFHVSDNPITAADLLQVVLIVLITFAVSAIVRGALRRLRDRRHISDTHSLYAAGRILHYLIITIGLLFGLSTLGLDFTTVALIAGALSVGIGFGLQTTVNNFVSGLILLFDRSLKVGDYVELDSGVRGTVREISVRATRINTNDNVDVVVPNSEFVSTRLTNWTMKESFARLRIPFGVAYGTDKQKVHDLAMAVAEKIDLTLTHMPENEPQVRLTGFGESSLDFELLVWVGRTGVQRPGRARANYYWELETALREAGIVIPFPQRDLHIRSGARNAPALEHGNLSSDERGRDTDQDTSE